MSKRSLTGVDEAEDVQSKLKKSIVLEPIFYKQPALDLAKAILGKCLVKILEDGTRVSGIIIDTEAYPGSDDKASHSFNGKRTGHNSALYEEAGGIYIHNTFGGNCTMFITCKGEGAAVYIRAVEPKEGLQRMRELRGKNKEDKGKSLLDADLCSGPAKLTQAFGITRANANKQNLAACDTLFIEEDRMYKLDDIAVGHRIGVEMHGKCAEEQWRFYIKGNEFLSIVENEGKKLQKLPSNSKKSAESTVPIKVDLDKIKAPHRLSTEFFHQTSSELARALLGKVLVRTMDDGEILKCSIVETESFPGGDDPASHSHDGVRTGHNAALYMQPGSLYIHNTFGGNCSLYICSGGEGAAVLIRALEPLEGLDLMEENRKMKMKSGSEKKLNITDLCSGPAKLTQSLIIKRDKMNKQDLRVSDILWIEEGVSPIETQNIIACHRIGIQSHGEWAKKPWRYYIKQNPHVSVIDKAAEKEAN